MSDSDFMYSDEENEFDFMESEDNQFEEFEGDDMEDDMDYLEDYIHSSNPNSQSTEAKKKPNHIEYETYDFNWVLQKQIEEAKHVSDIYGLAPYTATSLLRHFKWKKEKLLEQFAEDPDTILSKSGAIYDKDPKECTIDRNIPGFLCPVCYSEDSSVQSFKLPCGHRFCIECFEHYLNDKILSMEGHGIKCMEACSYKLDDSIIKMLVSSDNFKRYQFGVCRAFIDDNEKLKLCPEEECQNVVFCPISSNEFNITVPSVKCLSGHEICFGCDNGEHAPCPCYVVKTWLKKCEDDSETSNWIHAHTKECPKCSSTIEKNGGCNHMTCRKCSYEFCWMCMGAWNVHGQAWYNCNRFDDQSSKDARDKQARSRAQLERYLHYYNRYINHIQSAKLDIQLYQSTEKKMQDIQQEQAMTWIEVQFMKQAVDTIVTCRKTLQWTYAFAFYLKRCNMTQIFEDNQKDLEYATECLSELVEKPLEDVDLNELKRQIQDKAYYVSNRRDILLQDTAQGLLENRWEFNF